MLKEEWLPSAQVFGVQVLRLHLLVSACQGLHKLAFLCAVPKCHEWLVSFTALTAFGPSKPMIRETVNHPSWSVLKHTRSPTPYSFEIGALFLSIALRTLEDISTLMNAFLAFSRIFAIFEESSNKRALLGRGCINIYIYI